MNQRERIRLGIIGLGVISQAVHLPNLRRLTDLFEIRHVCDLSAQLAATIGSEAGASVRYGTDAAELIADPEVDAVLICTPGAHSELARRALEAGKHVLAEKPYAYDGEVARDDARFAASRGLVLQVGYMKMYEPVLPAARRALQEIGPVHLARMTVLHPSDERQLAGLSLRSFGDADPAALAAATAANRAEVAAVLSGTPRADPVLFRNVLHGSVCHQMSVLRALFPELVDAITVTHARREPVPARTDEPPKLQVLGAVGDQTQWSLSWNWLTDFPAYQEYLEVYGGRGSLRVDFPGPYEPGRPASLTTTVGSAEGARTSGVRPGPPDAFELELRAFAAAVADGASVLSDAYGAAVDADVLGMLAWILPDPD